MDLTNWIILGVGVVALGVGAVLYYRKKQKEMITGFENITEMLKQVPKQKKQSFILFMFREGVRAGKKANTASVQNKMNDPRYVEVQLLQMNLILKDRTKVTDKKVKQALQMYDSYFTWEKSKALKASKASEASKAPKAPKAKGIA